MVIHKPANFLCPTMIIKPFRSPIFFPHTLDVTISPKGRRRKNISRNNVNENFNGMYKYGGEIPPKNFREDRVIKDFG